MSAAGPVPSPFGGSAVREWINSAASVRTP